MLSRVIFNLLEEDESIELIVREYGITKSPVILWLLVLFCTLFFFMYPLFAFGSLGVGIFITGLTVIIWLAVRTAIMWYLDCLVITDVRMIDIVQTGLFSRRIQIVEYDAIDDLVYSRSGVWATLLNYGTLTLTFTSGADPLLLQRVFSPKMVRDYIMHNGQEKYHNQEESTH